MQGSWVAANQMLENCKERLLCSPDCCATPTEASRARMFPDVSRGSRVIRGDPQSVPAHRGDNFPQGVPDGPIRTESVVLRQRRCTRGCGRWCAEAGWPVVSRLCGVPLRLVSACGARVRVSSSDCPVLTAERVNPDWVVSCIGGNYLHRRYLSARDRAN